MCDIEHQPTDDERIAAWKEKIYDLANQTELTFEDPKTGVSFTIPHLGASDAMEEASRFGMETGDNQPLNDAIAAVVAGMMEAYRERMARESQ